MDFLESLHALARHFGVQTAYHDGLGRRVDVGPETLVRICAALGAELTRAEDAAHALRMAEARGQRLAAASAGGVEWRVARASGARRRRRDT